MSCGVPSLSLITEGEWDTCYNIDGNNLIVNFTPWGYVAKSSANTENLDFCYHRTPDKPIDKNRWLMNQCCGYDKELSDARTFLNDPPFEGIDAEHIARRATLLSETWSSYAAKTETKRSDPVQKEAFQFAMCARAVYGAAHLPDDIQANIALLNADVLEQINAKMATKKPKDGGGNKYFEDSDGSSVNAQLKAYFKPFSSLFDAQPSDLARSWLQDHYCMESYLKYLKGVTGNYGICTRFFNVVTIKDGGPAPLITGMVKPEAVSSGGGKGEEEADTIAL